MAMDTFWLLEKKIIFSKYKGEVSTQETCEENRILVEMIQAGDRPVHHLASARNITKLPMDLVKLMQCRTYHQEPKLGWLVIYGTNRLGKMLVNVVVGNYAGRTRAFDTYEQAIDFLLSVDDALQPHAEYLRQRTHDSD